MDNKKIAKYALSFIGGNPEVIEYLNDNETKKIDILICKKSDMSDNVTYATIGLANTNIGKTVDSTELRTEIIMTGTGDERFANILSSIAFVIQDSEDCGYTMIVNDVVTTYIENTELQHIILMYPVFWDKYEPLKMENKTVTWLMAVPITETERKYIQSNGFDAFEKLLEEKNIDISNLYRTSCI